MLTTLMYQCQCIMEYRDNYSETSGILCQFFKNEPARNAVDNSAMIDVNANNATTNSLISNS